MKVALIGRPNVGKSTLFNRLIERREAIETPIPGTTRDRHRGVFYWGKKKIELLDTPGLNAKSEKRKAKNFDDDVSELEYKIQLQAKHALKEADAILYIIDFGTGPVSEDLEIVRQLRKEKTKPIFLIVNKADKVSDITEAMRYIKLGMGEPIPVSAISGLGISKLLSALAQLSTPEEPESDMPMEQEAPIIKIALIGKTNVGKSSLFNALLKEERVVVSALPHTTRNPNDTEISYHKHHFIIIDTAGLRKKGKLYQSDVLEIFSVKKTLAKLKEADVAFLMLDASDRLSVQDLKIGELTKRNKASIIIIANKWDAVHEKTTRTLHEYRAYIYKTLRSMNFVPLVFTDVSDPYAGKIFGVEEKFLPLKERGDHQPLYLLLDMAIAVYNSRHATIAEEDLEKIAHEAYHKHAPPRDRGKPAPFIQSLKQIGTDPPLFQVTLKGRATIPSHYLGFLKNQIRERYPLWGTPIEVVTRDL